MNIKLFSCINNLAKLNCEANQRTMNSLNERQINRGKTMNIRYESFFTLLHLERKKLQHNRPGHSTEVGIFSLPNILKINRIKLNADIDNGQLERWMEIVSVWIAKFNGLERYDIDVYFCLKKIPIDNTRHKYNHTLQGKLIEFLAVLPHQFNQ